MASEQALVDFRGAGDAAVAVVGLLAVGVMRDQRVDDHVAGAGVEGDDGFARGIGREIR